MKSRLLNLTGGARSLGFLELSLDPYELAARVGQFDARRLVFGSGCVTLGGNHGVVYIVQRVSRSSDLALTSVAEVLALITAWT